jgi:hypothetical protein
MTNTINKTVYLRKSDRESNLALEGSSFNESKTNKQNSELKLNSLDRTFKERASVLYVKGLYNPDPNRTLEKGHKSFVTPQWSETLMNRT